MRFREDYLNMYVDSLKAKVPLRIEAVHYESFVEEIKVQKGCKIEVGNKKKKVAICEIGQINEGESLAEAKETFHGYVDVDKGNEALRQNYYIENVEIEKEAFSENY